MGYLRSRFRGSARRRSSGLAAVAVARLQRSDAVVAGGAACMFPGFCICSSGTYACLSCFVLLLNVSAVSYVCARPDCRVLWLEVLGVLSTHICCNISVSFASFSREEETRCAAHQARGRYLCQGVGLAGMKKLSEKLIF